MDANDALLTPADEIDFESLDDSVLFELATQTLEPFVATSALAQLSMRGCEMAADAAEAVLTGEGFDRHSTAHALTTLFTHEADRAMAHMRNIVQHCVDAKLLGAMVDNVMSDLTRFGVGSHDYGFARELARRVRGVDLHDFSDRDEVTDFLGRFT